jgi:large subunit ribosomal protein L29
MKYEDIASLSDKELVKRRKELRSEIFEASMKNSLGQLANPMTIRFMRRDIARLETALSAKASKAAPSVAKATKKTGAKGL